ncbi:MAG: DoxX family protein [Oceanobacter sp.]
MKLNLLSRDDFTFQAKNFDFTDHLVILRLATGLFMLPHAFSKFVDWASAARTVGFFGKAGFQPAEFWVWMAGGSEFTFSVLLVLGICSRWAALGLASVMVVATYAVFALKGFVWLAPAGGFEYSVFYGVMLIALAVGEFQRKPLFVATPVPAHAF